MRFFQRITIVTLTMILTGLAMPCHRALGQDLTAQMVGGRPDRSLLSGPTAYIFTGDSACSGILVGSRTVLTAGHCTIDFPSLDRYRVVVGDLLFRVSSITPHPLFDIAAGPLESAPFDVGVVELSSPATVAPLPVFVDRPLTPGTELTIAGYGTHEDSANSDEIEDNARIGRSLVYEVRRAGVFFQRHRGGGASTCPGDSGGPAILRESGYRGVVGTLSVGVNIVSGDNCELAGDGRFVHTYLQSADNLQFLSNFSDIQYISGYRIFIETACKSSVAVLRKVVRTSSLSNLHKGIRNTLSSVTKARDYADGVRLELLTQAIKDLQAGARSRRLSTSKSKVRAAIERLNEVKALGVY
jgi:trypsin